MRASIYFHPCWHQPLTDLSLALIPAFTLSVGQQLVSNAVVKIDKARISPSSDTKAFDWLWWTIYIIVIGWQFEKCYLKFANNHYPFPLSSAWLTVPCMCTARECIRIWKIPHYFHLQFTGQNCDIAKHFIAILFFISVDINTLSIKISLFLIANLKNSFSFTCQ